MALKSPATTSNISVEEAQEMMEQAAWAQAAQVSPAFNLCNPSELSDELPTLANSPDDLDLQQADVLHTRAARWLEYFERKISVNEAKLLIRKTELSQYKRRLDFKTQKKIQNLTTEELDMLDSLEQQAVTLEAEVVVFNGLKSGLDKVKAAASRTITRHTKTNLGLE